MDNVNSYMKNIKSCGFYTDMTMTNKWVSAMEIHTWKNKKFSFYTMINKWVVGNGNSYMKESKVVIFTQIWQWLTNG